MNLRALPSRFISTCRNFAASRRTKRRTSRAQMHERSRFLSAALTCIISVKSRASATTSTATGTNSCFPASIFAMSRTSLMMVRSCSPLRSIISKYSRCSPEVTSSRSKPVMPRIELRGLRNSWLMFARKMVFAELAASARSRAAASSAVRVSTSSATRRRCWWSVCTRTL